MKMILTSLHIPLVLVDISSPGTEEKRDFMRSKAEKKEGHRNVLPPQIFNGEKYCGVRKNQFSTMTTTLFYLWQDYEAFDIANEDDDLEEFLGLPRKAPKVGGIDI